MTALTQTTPSIHGLAADDPDNSGPEVSPVLVTVPRVLVWAVAAIIASGLVGIGQPLSLAPACLVLSFLAAVAMATTPEPARFTVAMVLPAGFVVLCAWCLGWGLALGSLGVDAWTSRTPALAGVVAFVGLTGVVAARRGGRVLLIGRDWPGVVGAGALLGFFCWIVASQPFALWSRINSSGTDFLRHLRAVRALAAEGSLDFGQSGYPPALHALAAWLTSAIGMPAGAEDLWAAVAPLAFLMLGLILLGLMVTATRLTDALVAFSPGHPGLEARVSSPLAGTAAALITALIFVQTAWFSSFLHMGHMMNIMVGVCLVSLLPVALQHRAVGSTTGSAIAASAIAVTANAWQLLLPVVGLGALPWIVAFLRDGRRRPADLVLWAVGTLLTVNGLLVLRSVEAGPHAAVATVSGLFAPEWWWGLAIALACLATVRAYWLGLRAWALGAIGMLVGGAGVTTFLIVWTRSTWELMRYYPVKSLWTSIVVAVPIAVAAAVWLTVAAWRRSHVGRPVVQLATMSALGLGAVVIVAGVLGRGASGTPHLASLADSGDVTPNWALAVVDSMHDVRARPQPDSGVIIFGLVPGIDPEEFNLGLLGVVDYMGMEALGLAGIPEADMSPVKAALLTRDMTQVCRYLREHPDSLRITGPNPAAGPSWIVGSGCPESVVDPQRWISLDIDPVWFERSPWEGGGWTFPTFDQVQAAAV